MDTADGKKIFSIVMIEPDKALSDIFQDFFKTLHNTKFIATQTLPGGLSMAEIRQADVIVTELKFENLADLDDRLIDQGWIIKGLKDVRPESKIIVYTMCDDEVLVHKHLTKFCVDAYLRKTEVTPLGLLRKIYELLGPAGFDIGPHLFQ